MRPSSVVPTTLATVIPAALLLTASFTVFGQSATMPCQDEAGRDASCELNSQLNASIRIGARFEDSESVDSDLTFSNFGSRLRWGGESALDNGLTGIAYMEFGINPDQNGRGNSGVDRTRQLWAGLKGDFGSLKVGAQYPAFYTMISSYTDIAYWGSCWTELKCSRETQVLKYEGGAGDLTYAASFAARSDGSGSADDLEGGVNYKVGDLTFGLGVVFSLDEDTDVDVVDPVTGATSTISVTNDGGALFGASAAGKFGDFGVSATFQSGDDDFADSSSTVTNLTVAGTYGNAYGVVNIGDIGDSSPYYATLGYAITLSPASTFYLEAQVVDSDTDADSDTIGRAVYIFNFDSAVFSLMDDQ